ncbi:MAG: class I SAM-dependent methyltransferase [Desulfamplus sp.]|nr:class I SAM-dependent methyltransferase [Desulfamplus sp.]
MKQWYEELFENYAVQYDREVFTQGTIGECDFIEQEIDKNRQIRILDIGCGTGRHSIEMAKRGYEVVGIDLSESLLQKAREKASHLEIELRQKQPQNKNLSYCKSQSSCQSLRVLFEQRDAREPHFINEFDLAIMICEGGFPLMETDEMNFLILKSAANALKSGGKFIFTTLNGLFPLFHSVKDFLSSQAKDDNATYGNHSFDLMTFRDKNTIYIKDDSENQRELQCNERYYVPSEITWLLKSLDFKTIDIFGAKLGAFSRSDKLSTEDYEMLVIAKK